jgi:hypothetical protein
MLSRVTRNDRPIRKWGREEGEPMGQRVDQLGDSLWPC